MTTDTEDAGMGQIWGAGLSEELDLDDAEGPHAGDSTAGLCLIQPTVVPCALMSPFPVPSLARDALPPFCGTSGTGRPMSLTSLAPFWASITPKNVRDTDLEMETHTGPCSPDRYELNQTFSSLCMAPSGKL